MFTTACRIYDNGECPLTLQKYSDDTQNDASTVFDWLKKYPENGGGKQKRVTKKRSKKFHSKRNKRYKKKRSVKHRRKHNNRQKKQVKSSKRK